MYLAQKSTHTHTYTRMYLHTHTYIISLDFHRKPSSVHLMNLSTANYRRPSWFIGELQSFLDLTKYGKVVMAWVLLAGMFWSIPDLRCCTNSECWWQKLGELLITGGRPGMAAVTRTTVPRVSDTSDIPFWKGQFSREERDCSSI